MTPIVIAFLGHDNLTFSYLRYVFNKFYQLEYRHLFGDQQ